MSGHTHIHTQLRCAQGGNKLFEALKLIMYLRKIAHALRISKHVTESIRNIARGVGIN